MKSQQREALARLGAFATANEPLAPYTTYRVGGAADIFAAPRNVEDLYLVAEVVRETGLPTLIVGRGSNLLVSDAGFAGIAISLAAMAEWVKFDDVTVDAGAAMALPVLARRCVAMGLVGFEWAVGVPGSLGGAVRMNAGGHGSDVAASLVGAHLLDLKTAVQGWVPAEQLRLRFRGSDVGDHQVVLDAQLLLQHGDVAAAEATLAEIVRWRREHQPGGQNAGSVFVNPVPGQVAAAELIDKVGLRGFRIGGASVSEKHANFIQASEGCTAADVIAVIGHVRAEVGRSFGFELRTEITLVGFDDVPWAADLSLRHAGVPL